MVSTGKTRIMGRPDMKAASTSYVERQNLNMRLYMRRFTRLTNAFSKKAENLRAAVALHFFAHNLIRKHLTLKETPAMATGLTDRPWKVAELVYLAN